MNTKYVIYIAIVAVLLIAWYYRTNIYYSISPKVKSAKMVSPYVDDRIEGQIKQTMGRQMVIPFETSPSDRKTLTNIDMVIINNDKSFVLLSFFLSAIHISSVNEWQI